MTLVANFRRERMSQVSASMADRAGEIKRGSRFMMFRKVLVAGAAAFVCAALIGLNPRPASAQSNPPLRALSAKGNSFDGFFQQGNTCDYCDGALCGCFLADSNGGTGSLKFDSRAPVSMAWNIELDYANNDQYDNGTYGSCCARLRACSRPSLAPSSVRCSRTPRLESCAIPTSSIRPTPVPTLYKPVMPATPLPQAQVPSA